MSIATGKQIQIFKKLRLCDSNKEIKTRFKIAKGIYYII